MKATNSKGGDFNLVRLTVPKKGNGTVPVRIGGKVENCIVTSNKNWVGNLPVTEYIWIGNPTEIGYYLTLDPGTKASEIAPTLDLTVSDGTAVRKDPPRVTSETKREAERIRKFGDSKYVLDLKAIKAKAADPAPTPAT